MAVMPRECSYNVLVANDIMGPLDVDICRSQDAVLFHFQGREFAIPLLMKHAEQKEGIPRKLLRLLQSTTTRALGWTSCLHLPLLDSKNPNSPLSP